jgi:type IV secretion system protein VirB9
MRESFSPRVATPLANLILAAALAISGAGAAFAEIAPRSIGADPRIKQYTYNPTTVYRLDVAMKIITSIEFAPGEAIDSVLMGDSESWEVIRLQSGSVLAVKPLIAGARTNMTVYTSQRTYTFELRAVPARVGSASLNYRIGFRYPEQDRARAASKRATAARPRDPNYYVAGQPTGFRPIEVYDDGRTTTFVFAENAPRPAIFRANAAGRESIVNLRETGNSVVVTGTSDRWTLRVGDEELCVAHARVIRTVPGGDRAATLRASVVATGKSSAHATARGLPK